MMRKLGLVFSISAVATLAVAIALGLTLGEGYVPLIIGVSMGVLFVPMVVITIIGKIHIEWPDGIRRDIKLRGYKATTFVVVPKDPPFRPFGMTDEKILTLSRAMHEATSTVGDILVANGKNPKEVAERIGHMVFHLLTDADYDHKVRMHPQLLQSNGTQGWIKNGPAVATMRLKFADDLIANGHLAIHEILHAWRRWDSFHDDPDNVWEDREDGDPSDDLEEKAQQAFRSPDFYPEEHWL